MVERGIIQHASGSAKQKLVEGFIIFFFTPKKFWAEKTEGEWLIGASGNDKNIFPLKCLGPRNDREVGKG